MKNLFNASFLIYVIIFTIGCSKEEKISYTFPETSLFVRNNLDNWLEENLLKPYNINVKYRYDRYKGDIDRNIAPPDEGKVKDQMISVIEGFLKPYENIAGKTFIKNYTPKEWVLFGSESYNKDGSQVLGTASGGRNVTLYEVNNFNINNSDVVRRKLRTIHHEFTHILQQNRSMPLDFESISAADYFDDWTNNTLNSQKLSDSLGFISRYARSQYFEDFAETSAHLLVEGQNFYDNQATKFTKVTYDKLKSKENLVVKYFQDSYGVDFRKLQREVQAILYEKFNDKTNQSLGKWMLVEKVVVIPAAATANQYSSDVDELLNTLRTAVFNQHTTNKYRLEPLKFTFNTTDKTLVIRMPFTSTGGTQVGTTFNADYNFTYTIDAATSRVTFTKAEQGTGTVYNNAALFTAAFATTISNYLTSSPFIAEWSAHDPAIDRRDEQFFQTGGFYKQNNRNSFINFSLNRVTK